jgi:predicted DNA-binding protein (UPF0251 family)
MDGLTLLEKKQMEIFQKEVRRILRLSSERDLYNYNQASFRLNVSRNTFEEKFIKTGLLVFVEIRGERWIAKKDIDKMVESTDRYVHRDSLRRKIADAG